MLCSTWILLIVGTSVTQMQIMQIFFGIATSSDIAYQSYLYAVVHKKHFKRITSYVRTSTMVGKFLSYSVGQLLVSTGSASYLLLNQITLFCMCLVVPIALCLPYVEKSKPDQKEVVLELGVKEEEENEPLKIEINGDLEMFETKEENLGFISKFSVLVKNPTVLGWSIWWALTSCGMWQVFNYAQTLWSLRQKEGQIVANGLVEAVNTLLSALMTFLLQFIQFDWQHHGQWIFSVSSLLIAALLAVMIQLKNILVDFAFYLLISSFYHVLLAVASNLIASQLPPRSYSLIFGFNTFLALTFQCLLTFSVADKNGLLALDIETQFQVYSGYFAAISFLFLVMMILSKLFRTN